MNGGRIRRISVGFAAGYLSVVVVCAVFAGWVATHDPEDADFSSSLAGAGRDHLLGADRLGRDTFSRLVHGGRVALLAASEATLIAVLVGIPVGLFIGYRAGWVDRIAMRVIDGIASIPGIVLAIALIAALGTGLSRSMAAVGLVFATVMARLARGQVLSERERLYVDGARVAGAGKRAIMFRHVLPNVAPVLIVQATLVFSTAIAVEAGLSFIGLGVQPPSSSWGIMLSDAQQSIALDAFQAVPPGLAIFLTVLAVNLLGDHLQGRFVGNQKNGGGTVLRPAAVERIAGPTGICGDRTVLAVDDLSVSYRSAGGEPVVAVERATLRVDAGEVLAIVGESGCGKSSLGLGIAGLLSPPAHLTAASVRIAASTGVVEVASADEDARRSWRRHVGVVFQEPGASLNPVHTVGRQLTRALRSRGLGTTAARQRAVELLGLVQIPDAPSVFAKYPHQISGGMAQRVMIALALAQEPEVLIADEPTTALDVTVQAEILQILRSLCDELDLAVVLITHDLGVVSELADRVAVMYAGRIVEEGTVVEVVGTPRHPYTAALAGAVPRNEAGAGLPKPLPGSVPDPGHWPTGCRFAARCIHASVECGLTDIQLERQGRRSVACIRADELELIGISEEVRL